MTTASLVSDFEAYSQWRLDLSQRIADYRQWLNREDLNDSQRDLRLQQLIDRLAEDKLHVAFIAEFSRGKSELINAIFLSDLKQRLLPSTAGRTTMCPTELLYDPAKPPMIELLPIETRGSNATISEYKNYPEEWTQVQMDTTSPDSVTQAMQEVCRVKTVPVEDATRYGLYNPDDKETSLSLNDDGNVTIPAWRHAIINFPHPFLEKGLVVYDTPGLNAIGVEPELTFNLLPNAHAVLFVLAADTGVTKSDIEVWRNHIYARGNNRGRLVALNKIDGLWDELKTETQIQAELDGQVRSCAELLGVDAAQIYPVSAQKGLLAKINGDQALLERSRLAALEKALSEELIASKQSIVRDQTEAELGDLLDNSLALLESRRKGIDEQLGELRGLQGKNQDVVEHIMSKISTDKEVFERGLQQFQALRSIYSQQSIKLFAQIGMDALREEVRQARELMVKSRFTKGIRDAMTGFFTRVDQRLDGANGQIEEINKMMEAMYRKLNQEHGINLISIPPFSMLRYRKEMQRLEEAYEQKFNTFYTFLTTEQYTLTSRFFETLATRVVQVFEVLNKDVENWLKAVMSPMESQVREHQMQLRRRLESVKRIHKAADTLEDRIGELDQMQTEVLRQVGELEGLTTGIRSALASTALQEATRAAA
ncbi:MAG TPA: dynamin family protein [Thiobacillaceae bacterium]|nr:dynamin family protein [Thiobacillaceae bacterium]HNA82304.1 dynamin family protein [Thiobacillaceae bacterium]HNF88842.1 dynamin family protein [Thiobacillaceae bacterium]HNH88902.1 dynamin family protein [Thiobacillaceae bacterium]HNI07654.1 dynamin family protein [Thiobacillaceae bacterium]